MICTLAEVRKAKGVTQEQLSEMTGINRVSIAKYETGKAMPSVKNAGRLADALEVSITDIVKAG